MQNLVVQVDFDGIVANCAHDNEYYYTGCQGYVSYEGPGVDGSTITLGEKRQYEMNLVAANGNQSQPEGLHGFVDSDLTFNNDPNPNQLSFTATNVDLNGKNLYFEANFTDANGNACTARWDPVIIVDVDPD